MSMKSSRVESSRCDHNIIIYPPDASTHPLKECQVVVSPAQLLPNVHPEVGWSLHPNLFGLALPAPVHAHVRPIGQVRHAACCRDDREPLAAVLK